MSNFCKFHSLICTNFSFKIRFSLTIHSSYYSVGLKILVFQTPQAMRCAKSTFNIVREINLQ